MKPHRGLDIAQNSACDLSHRVQATLCSAGKGFVGPVEVDATYLGGKRKNMPNAMCNHLTGRRTVGKTAVLGAEDRATNQAVTTAVPATDKDRRQDSVKDCADQQTRGYTDEASAYETLPFQHESVKHSVSASTCADRHRPTEWSLLVDAETRLLRAVPQARPAASEPEVQELAGRQNLGDQDTVDMMGAVVLGMDGKRLKCEDLIKDNGLASGARA